MGSEDAAATAGEAVARASAHAHRARTRRLRAAVVVAGAVLCAASAVVGAWPDEARAWVAAALLALPAAGIGLRALAGLTAHREQPLPDPGFGLPPDLATTRAALLALEARLEHAPVALWRVEGTAVQPLNVAARRLLAPGGASDPAALQARLGAAPAGGRAQVAFDTDRGHERALLASAAVAVAGDDPAQAPRIVALMPIEAELETETLDAWQQLVHVLTHEIMNSLTPIASLARSAHELAGEAADPDLATALEAIARRSAHLVAFVESYRSVSRWPAPQRTAVVVAELLAGVQRLLAPVWAARGGDVVVSVEPGSLQLMADAAQLEQVLINLAKNAAEATEATPQPRLEISARLVRGGRLQLVVADNGPGVPPGLESRIFTPFFTTRAQGTGVGLSVVRHLVHGMGGTVRHGRRASGGAAFILTF